MYVAAEKHGHKYGICDRITNIYTNCQGLNITHSNFLEAFLLSSDFLLATYLPNASNRVCLSHVSQRVLNTTVSWEQSNDI